MFFASINGKNYLCVNEKPLFEITEAFVCCEENEKTKIAFCKISEKEISFSDTSLNADIKCRITESDGAFAIKIEASYNPVTLFDKKGNIHFFEEKGVGISLKAVKRNRFVALYRGSEWWSRAAVTDELGALPVFTQALLFKEGNECCCLTAFCDGEFKSNMSGNGDGTFDLYAYDNCRSNGCDCIAALFSLDGDFSSAVYKTVYGGFVLSGRKPIMRKDRNYPEILNGLGFCSWDAFNIEVSEENLLAKADEFAQKGVPVKWFMIDDMWGEVKNNKLGVNSTRELYSFKADADRFKNGLDGAVLRLHQKGLKVGLWYPTTGYWNGLDPNGEIANDRDYRNLIFWSQEGMLVHRFDEESINSYYLKQNAYYKDCGIDFIKVDNQACLRRFSKRIMPIGVAARNLHGAIEMSADKYFGGQLINCMGMSLENYWNRKSAVCRITCDYAPNDRARFNLTVRQAAYNGLMYSPVYYGDFDMWWTCDSQKYKNAASRSISGGPIYISDKLGGTDAEIILRLVYSDGAIIRMPNPALPADDCFFDDCAQNGKPFKIYNSDKGNGAVIAYNISEDGNRVEGSISAADACLDETKSYIAYNPFTYKYTVVGPNEKINISLENGDDFVMLIFAPLSNNAALLGLKEKIVCFECVENNTVKDSGTLIMYNKSTVKINGKETKCALSSNGLFEISVNKGDVIE